MTRREWAVLFLKEIKAPVSNHNLWAIVSWIQAEGCEAAWNPLATTQNMPGATNFNWIGVKNYTSAEQGVEATAKTLNYGADNNLYGYRPIRRRLRKSRPAYWTLRAVEASAWGTGGLALKCLPMVKDYWDHFKSIPIPD